MANRPSTTRARGPQGRSAGAGAGGGGASLTEQLLLNPTLGTIWAGWPSTSISGCGLVVAAGDGHRKHLAGGQWTAGVVHDVFSHHQRRLDAV